MVPANLIAGQHCGPFFGGPKTPRKIYPEETISHAPWESHVPTLPQNTRPKLPAAPPKIHGNSSIQLALKGSISKILPTRFFFRRVYPTHKHVLQATREAPVPKRLKKCLPCRRAFSKRRGNAMALMAWNKNGAAKNSPLTCAGPLVAFYRPPFFGPERSQIGFFSRKLCFTWMGISFSWWDNDGGSWGVIGYVGCGLFVCFIICLPRVSRLGSCPPPQKRCHPKSLISWFC